MFAAKTVNFELFFDIPFASALILPRTDHFKLLVCISVRGSWSISFHFFLFRLRTVVVVGSLYWARSRLQPSTFRTLFRLASKAFPPRLDSKVQFPPGLAESLRSDCFFAGAMFFARMTLPRSAFRGFQIGLQMYTGVDCKGSKECIILNSHFQYLIFNFGTFLPKTHM